MPPSPVARHLLILHGADDEAFVRGYLAPALGLPPDAGDDCQAGMALSSRELAARPVRELARLVGESRYIVPVLSPAALADPWVQLTDELASHGAASDGDLQRGVIPLLLADCELPLHLRASVALDLRKRRDWDDETARLLHQLARPALPPPEVPCPYPGMRPFQGGDAAFFHGRDAEIAEVVSRLAAGQRELMVIGPSGSGKSSLIAAGVVPRLAGQWLVRSLRPGAEPRAALAAALGGHAAEDATEALLLGRPETGLLLLIDQAEELFSLASAEERQRFTAMLRALRKAPRCALILTLRADFFGELLGSELWRDGAKQHLDLAPMRGQALRTAIEEPARQRRVFLEKGLVDQLLTDAADEPGALPLLQEALVQLWGARRQRLLTLDEYRDRGGLSAALVSHADRTLGALTEPRRQLARRVLLRLVAFGEGRPNTRRRQPREALRGEEAASELDAVLMALAQSRLVIMDSGSGSESTSGSRAEAIHVDLCHDILITAWPSFAAWVEARRTAEQQRRRWQGHARAWISRGRGEAAQLDADELAEARAWASSAEAVSVGVDPDIAALIASSARLLAAKQLRRRRRIVATIAALASFTAVSLLLATCAVLQRREARSQAQLAVAARGETAAQLAQNRRLLAAQYEDAARRFLVEDRAQRALPYLLAARLEHGEPPSAISRALFRAASWPRVHAILREAQLPPASPSLGAVPISELADGQDCPLPGPRTHAFRFDGGVALVCLTTLELFRAEGAHHSIPMPLATTGALLLGDHRSLAVMTMDSTAHVWDLATGRLRARFENPFGAALAASPDGDHVVVRELHGLARSWQLPPLEEQRLLELPGDGTDVEPSHDGKWLALATAQGVLVASARLDAPPQRLALRRLTPWRLAISPDDRWIAAQSWQRGTALCEVASQRCTVLHQELDRSMEGIAEVVSPLAFSPDSALLATLRPELAEQEIQLWELRTGQAAGPPLRHGRASAAAAPGELVSLRFSPDGKRLVSASSDGTARLFDVATGQPLGAPLAHQRPSPLTFACFSPDGARLVTTADDGTVELRDARTLQRTRELRHDSRVMAAVFSPDGATLATLGADFRATLWVLSSGKRLHVLEQPNWVTRLAFSPDGSRLISLGMEMRMWSVATGQPLTPPLFHRLPAAAPSYPADARAAFYLQSKLEEQERVYDLAFSRDGAWLFTLGRDRTLRRWDVSLDGASLEEWQQLVARSPFAALP